MMLDHDITKLVDIPKLTTWLDENIPELGNGPLDAKLIHGGTTNVILSLDRGRQTMVLRRPPAVAPPGSEKTVLREARVLRALNGTRVPHPICYGSCDDPNVIGAAFYVMQKVDGWAGDLRDEKIHHRPPFDKPPFEYMIPFAVCDALIALANIDYKSVGLEGFGKPERFLERQVDRWAGQLASYKTLYNYPGREYPGYDATEQWLRANTPKDYKLGIIHGDLGTTNMLFAYDPPARLNALIDWELSTIGDPMIDLAQLCSMLRDERIEGSRPDSSIYLMTDLPSKQQIIRYYEAGTGRDVSQFDYYTILTRFKGGCILEYKVAQAAAGILPEATGTFFARQVLQSFASAADFIKKFG